MEAVTRTQLREWTEANLRTLRHSFRPRDLPAEWEKDLASLPRETLAQDLLFYVRVKHYGFLRYQQLQREHAAESDISPERVRAMRELQTREPVRITLAGRPVEVTFRGRKALIELAEHDLSRREIERDLDRLAELAAYTERQRDAGRISHTHARRRLRQFRAIHAKYFREMLSRTRAILANALTPDGRAAGPDDAPWVAWGESIDWWECVTPDDETNLLLALFRAGPERLETLGPAPVSPDQAKERQWVEDFGFWSLYSYFEKDAGLGPGAFVDEDVAQFSAWLRAGTPYYPPPGGRSRERMH